MVDWADSCTFTRKDLPHFTLADHSITVRNHIHNAGFLNRQQSKMITIFYICYIYLLPSTIICNITITLNMILISTDLLREAWYQKHHCVSLSIRLNLSVRKAPEKNIFDNLSISCLPSESLRSAE